MLPSIELVAKVLNELLILIHVIYFFKNKKIKFIKTI